MIGERILSGVPGFGEVARSIRYENERWDGGGYPDGLARDQIPLATRIVFACDAYQAMTSDRPYRPAMGQVKARGELRDGAGTQFDPRVAPALLEILGDAAPPPACSPSESCNRARSVELAELAAEIGAHDLFVFRKVADQLYSHLGGRRPGARGGLGISKLDSGQESRLREVIASGVPICVELPQTGRIIGPYYGRSAAIVPCEDLSELEDVPDGFTHEAGVSSMHVLAIDRPPSRSCSSSAPGPGCGASPRFASESRAQCPTLPRSWFVAGSPSSGSGPRMPGWPSS